MNIKEQIYAEGNNWLAERGYDYIKLTRVSQGNRLMWEHENTDITKPTLDKANLLELEAHLKEFINKLQREGSINPN